MVALGSLVESAFEGLWMTQRNGDRLGDKLRGVGRKEPGILGFSGSTGRVGTGSCRQVVTELRIVGLERSEQKTQD